MRGICATFIVFSHMYRNTQIYNNQLVAGIVSLISPSLLCMFFFYAGFAVMYKYKKLGGGQRLYKCLISWNKSVIIPAAVALILSYVQGHIWGITEEERTIGIIFNELGGWFLKTYIILQVLFWISSLLVETNKQLLVLLNILIVASMILMRIVNLQSYYYIDCLAFGLGAFSCVYDNIWKKIIGKKISFYSCVCLTVLIGGGIPILLKLGIIPAIGGVGLLAGILNSLSQCVMYQGVMARFKFKSKNIFLFLGKCSYEVYLMGPCAYTVALNIAKTSTTYYIIYIIYCVIGGLLLNKACKLLYSIFSDFLYQVSNSRD